MSNNITLSRETLAELLHSMWRAGTLDYCMGNLKDHDTLDNNGDTFQKILEMHRLSYRALNNLCNNKETFRETIKDLPKDIMPDSEYNGYHCWRFILDEKKSN